MLPHFSRDDDIEIVAAALQSRGAVVIDELLPDNIVAGLSADLRPEFDREGHLYQNSFNGHQTLRVGGVTKYSSYFPTLLLHSSVLAIADVILKPHCEVYQVGSTTAIEILPGEDEQVLHADDACYPSPLRHRFRLCGRWMISPLRMVRRGWCRGKWVSKIRKMRGKSTSCKL